MRSMDRENGMYRGWICGWERTGRIGDDWALSLLKRGLRRTDCWQEKKREIPLFPYRWIGKSVLACTTDTELDLTELNWTELGWIRISLFYKGMDSVLIYFSPDYRWHNTVGERCDCAEKAKWQSTWVWNTKKERAMMHRGIRCKGIWNRGKGLSASILRIEQDE